MDIPPVWYCEKARSAGKGKWQVLYYEQYVFKRPWFFFLLLKNWAPGFDLPVSLRNSDILMLHGQNYDAVLRYCNSSAKILEHVACCEFAVIEGNIFGHFRGRGGLSALSPQVLPWKSRHSQLQVVGSQSCLLVIAPIFERSCAMYDAFCSLVGVSTAFSIQIFNFKSLPQFNTEPLMHL